ncbi:hypothetical protein [Nocardia puris]|uniref:hypothetical protein n=1 Tax=Nocardia puris TaxID=208602 RepID=UPI0011BD8997|nr:hypothetical protein [Nocardia puris]
MQLARWREINSNFLHRIAAVVAVPHAPPCSPGERVVEDHPHIEVINTVPRCSPNLGAGLQHFPMGSEILERGMLPHPKRSAQFQLYAGESGHAAAIPTEAATRHDMYGRERVLGAVAESIDAIL